MASNPLSAKKTLAAVFAQAKALDATIDQTNAQRDALIRIGAAANSHTAILSRDFFGRFRWLFLGK